MFGLLHLQGPQNYFSVLAYHYIEVFKFFLIEKRTHSSLMFYGQLESDIETAEENKVVYYVIAYQKTNQMSRKVQRFHLKL